VQDNGQNPNADDGRANGTPRPVAPEQAQASATGWPGVQDIPSPHAERVAPWSAEHFASQPGWVEKDPAARKRGFDGPSGDFPAPRVEAPPAASGAPTDPQADDDGSWFQPTARLREDEPASAEELSRPYVSQRPNPDPYAADQGSAPAFPYGGATQYSDQPAAQPGAPVDEPDPEQTTQYAPPPPAEPTGPYAEPDPYAVPDPYGSPDPYAAQEAYAAAEPPPQDPYAQPQYPAQEPHPAPEQYDPYAPPPQYGAAPNVSQHAFPPRPEHQQQYDPAQYQHPEAAPPGYPQQGYPGYPPQGYLPLHQPPPPPHQPAQAPPHQPAQAPPMPAQPMAPPPTAEEFAARRAHKPVAPEATMGVPALIRRVSFGMVAPAPSRKERDFREAIKKVRRNFGGLRQITVVNPKGGAGKTVAALMTAMTFGQSRGGYVLAWDNNETQGTLGMRAQQDFHTRTVRDVLHELATFMGVHGRVGDLSSYVRSQGEAMFDVLASDESATAGEMLTARAFADIREVVSRFYKLIIVDTGNNVRAENWQAAIDATDQLVVTMSARGDSAETAARMLDHLEQTGRDQLVRQAVTVVSMPASRKGVDLPAIQRHFAARTRQVLVAPSERLLVSGEPIRYGELTQESKDAWLKIAAAIAEGL
jgi:MinD-like ATPase involved in chromosome partitioning or flagellar assembly